jgi:carboxyl-terminal processing protease
MMTMKNKLALLCFAMVLAVSSCSFTTKKFDTENDKDKVLIELITYVIEENHYDMRDIDDNFSKQVYAGFLESLDPMKRHFTKKDLKDFKDFETKIDDQIKEKDISFFNMVYERYQESLKVTEEFYKSILENDFDFDSDEMVNTDYENLDYAKNINQLKERWRLQLKFSVLSNYYSALETQNALAKESDTVEIKSHEDLKKEALVQTTESIERYFSNSNDLRREDWFNLYVNTVVEQFDPHTNYLAPRDKDRFDVSMSGKLEGIGARLQKLRDNIKIVEIISGGPAWRGKELEVGDLIVKVKQEDEDKAVSITGMRIDDAVDLIKGPKGTIVTLTVKKVDGTFKDIKIERDVVEIEETYAKSTIIEKDGIDFGFINLPKFYFNMENYKERNAASDIKKEIESLKKSDIQGLVIDLRNNGGGSLTTVVEMAGLFIDKGPVVQVKTKDGDVEVLEDKKRGTIWDGPLVILVNELSASASEILAAAMQDYKRAVIIGSRQTYGKGTVQNVANLNRWMRNSSFGDMGALKLTTQKFYRINGSSTQLKGVESDVVVPDRYSFIDIGERDYNNPLPYDKIRKADFEVWDGYDDYLDEIVKASQKRMDTNTQIGLIEEQAKWIKMQRDKNEFPLNFEAYKNLMEQTDKEAEKFDSMGEYENMLAFKFLPEEVELFQTDEALKDKRENWHKSLQKDIYVEEAVYVLEDLKEHTKNFKLADASSQN